MNTCKQRVTTLWPAGVAGLLAVAVVIAGLFVFGPYEPVEAEITLDPAAIAADPAGYLAASDSRFDDILPGLEKQIVWAGDPGAKTPLTVVYFHGFSASANEIRPVPDRVARNSAPTG